MSKETFTVQEIADYISGWASGPFDSVKEIGAAVLNNALNQLEDDQDGIAAVRRRKQARAGAPVMPWLLRVLGFKGSCGKVTPSRPCPPPPPRPAAVQTKIYGDPIRCPYCGGDEVSDVNGITTRVLTNESDQSDVGTVLDLDEWQCRGACEGRSFWV